MRRTRTTTGLAGTVAALLLLATPSPGQLEITPPTSEPRTASEMSQWDRPIPEGAANVTFSATPIGGSRVLLIVDSQRPRGMAFTSNSLIDLDLRTGEWTARHPVARRIRPFDHAAGKLLFRVLERGMRDGETTFVQSVWMLDTADWQAKPLFEPGEDATHGLVSTGWLSSDGSVAALTMETEAAAARLPRWTALVYRDGDPEPVTHEAWMIFRYAELSPDGGSILRLTPRIKGDPEAGDPIELGATVLESIDTATGRSETHDIDLESITSFVLSPDGSNAAVFTYDYDNNHAIDLAVVDLQQAAIAHTAPTGLMVIEHTPRWIDQGVIVGFRPSYGSPTVGAVLYNAQAEEIGRWTFPGKVISSWFSLPGEEHPYAVVDNEDIVQLLPDGAFRPVWSLRLLEK